MDPVILIVVAIVAYAMWQGSGSTQATVPGPGRMTVIPGSHPDGSAPGPGAGPLAPLVPLIAKTIDKALPTGTAPNAPTIRPPTPSSLVGMSAEWATALANAGQGAVDIAGALVSTGLAPDAAANIAVTMVGPYGIPTGEQALAVTLATEGSQATATGIGSSFAGSIGFAVPLAAATVIGGLVLGGDFMGWSAQAKRDEAEGWAAVRAKLQQLGRVRAYQIVNANLDALLATGEYSTDPAMNVSQAGFHVIEFPSMVGTRLTAPLDYSGTLGSALSRVTVAAMGQVFGKDAAWQAIVEKDREYVRRAAAERDWFRGAGAYMSTGHFWGPLTSQAEAAKHLQETIAAVPGVEPWMQQWPTYRFLATLSPIEVIRWFELNENPIHVDTFETGGA